MDDAAWERHCYIMDLADRDALFRDSKALFNELLPPFNELLDRLPDGQRDLICDYLATFQYMNLQLFTLACGHLRLPGEPAESREFPERP